jgi:hypothetical protein
VGIANKLLLQNRNSLNQLEFQQSYFFIFHFTFLVVYDALPRRNWNSLKKYPEGEGNRAPDKRLFPFIRLDGNQDHSSGTKTLAGIPAGGLSGSTFGY